MEDNMEHTINYNVRYYHLICCFFVSFQYDIKLLMNGKKIIVNGITIYTTTDGRSQPIKSKINEKILYNDDIQLSKSQIDLLKLFYNPGSYCDFGPDADGLKQFCEIIDDMKKDKNKDVFTREDIDGYNKIILNNKLILNKLKIETDKKNKILIDKINRIKHNILEKTIENNKLKLQLEDITEIYNLLLYKLK